MPRNNQRLPLRVRRPPPKTLTVALDEQTLNRLKGIARHKQVRARHLVAMWCGDEYSKILLSTVPQSHGRKSVARGLLLSLGVRGRGIDRNDSACH